MSYLAFAIATVGFQALLSGLLVFVFKTLLYRFATGCNLSCSVVAAYTRNLVCLKPLEINSVVLINLIKNDNSTK